MSTIKMLERQFARTQALAPVSPSGDSGLGAALEQLIDEQVQQRVSEALERHRERLKPPKLRRTLDSFDQADPASKPWRPLGEPFPHQPETWRPEDFGDGQEPARRQYIAPLKREPVEATLQRDGAGLARQITVNGVVFKVERGNDGRVSSMVQEP